VNTDRAILTADPCRHHWLEPRRWEVCVGPRDVCEQVLSSSWQPDAERTSGRSDGARRLSDHRRARRRPDTAHRGRRTWARGTESPTSGGSRYTAPVRGPRLSDTYITHKVVAVVYSSTGSRPMITAIQNSKSKQ